MREQFGLVLQSQIAEDTEGYQNQTNCRIGLLYIPRERRVYSDQDTDL